MLTDEDILAEFNGEKLYEDPLEIPNDEVDKEIHPPCANADGTIEVLQIFLFSGNEDEKKWKIYFINYKNS